MVRKSIVLAGLVILLLWLVPVNTLALEKPIKMDFWIFSDQQKRYFDEFLPEWQEKFPHVDIDIKLMGGDQLWQKLMVTLVSAKGAPDIAAHEIGQVAKFFRGVIGFVDLTERIKSGNYYDKVIETRWVPWSYKGRIYAVPQDCHPTVILYRRDILDEGGFPSDPESVTDLFKTWDDYVEIGKKLCGGVKDRYMIALSKKSYWTFWPFLLQGGGGIFNEEGEVIIDNEVAVRTLEFYVDLFVKHKLAIEHESDVTFFAALKENLLVTAMGPDWYVGYIKQYVPELKGKWGGIPLPAFEVGGRRTATMGGTAFAITKQSKYPDEAWEFLKYCLLRTDTGVRRYLIQYQLPPLKEVWEDPRIAVPDPFFGGQKLGTLFGSLAEDIPAFYQTPAWPEALEFLGEAIGDAVSQLKSPEQALKDAAKKIRRE